MHSSQSITLKCCQCAKNHKLSQPTALNQYQPFLFQYCYCLLLSNCVGRCIHTTRTHDSCEGVDISSRLVTVQVLKPTNLVYLRTPNSIPCIVLFQRGFIIHLHCPAHLQKLLHNCDTCGLHFTFLWTGKTGQPPTHCANIHFRDATNRLID